MLSAKTSNEPRVLQEIGVKILVARIKVKLWGYIGPIKCDVLMNINSQIKSERSQKIVEMLVIARIFVRFRLLYCGRKVAFAVLMVEQLLWEEAIPKDLYSHWTKLKTKFTVLNTLKILVGLFAGKLLQ